MTSPCARCARCGVEFPVIAPVTFAVAGVQLADREFCTDACANAWSRAEVVRLGAWLRAIARRSRGFGGDLAGLALKTQQTAEDYLGERERS